MTNRRTSTAAVTLIAVSTLLLLTGCSALDTAGGTAWAQPGAPAAERGSALEGLNQLAEKGRAPRTGYARSKFGKAWTDDNTALWGGNRLSTREDILSRDLTGITCKTARATPPCVVQGGVLNDPYTGTTLNFVRGEKSSQEAPIEHVVALSDAWQKGAQQLSYEDRVNFGNDPLNLIVTTREPNEIKIDADAATWLPPNKAFRCTYVARQVAVKLRYRLWVTSAEKEAITAVLSKCPGQPLPNNTDAATRTPAA